MVNYRITYTPKDGRGYNPRQRDGAVFPEMYTYCDALPQLKQWASLKIRLHKAYGQRFIAYSDSNGMRSQRVTTHRSYVTYARSHGAHHRPNYRESFECGNP